MEQVAIENEQGQYTVIELEKPKRSAAKTVGVKIWFLLMVLFGIGLLAVILFVTLFVKPNIGLVTSWDDVFWNRFKTPDWYYWNQNHLTTVGIVLSSLVGAEFCFFITTIILYKKASFKIGKKGSFSALLAFILFFTICAYLVGMLNNSFMFENLPSSNDWKWVTIFWQASIDNASILQPTIVWWIGLVLGCLEAFIVLCLFISFLFKFLFARSHDKKN